MANGIPADCDIISIGLFFQSEFLLQMNNLVVGTTPRCLKWIVWNDSLFLPNYIYRNIAAISITGINNNNNNNITHSNFFKF